MTIVATASANSSPLANPNEDITVDLSSVDVNAIPAQNVYSAAVDSGDGGASFSFQWYILSFAAGAPALADATVQNTTLALDAWGNVLLFVVATNTATLERSEENPFLAPRSALLKARVLSAQSGIEKLAAAERDYHPALAAWAQAIEDQNGSNAGQVIRDHSDVEVATGPRLDRLVNGSYAETPASPPLVPLAISYHKHRAGDLDAGTQSTIGAMRPVFPPVDALAPRALNRQTVVISGVITHHCNSAGVWTLGISKNDATTKVNVSPYAAVFQIPNFVPIFGVSNLLYVESWKVALSDGGVAAPVKSYQFDLRTGNAAALAAGTLATVPTSTALTGTPDNDFGPLEVQEVLGPNAEVSALDSLALRVSAAPDGADPLGFQATFTAVLCMRY